MNAGHFLTRHGARPPLIMTNPDWDKPLLTHAHSFLSSLDKPHRFPFSCSGISRDPAPQNRAAASSISRN